MPDTKKEEQVKNEAEGLQLKLMQKRRKFQMS